MIRTEPTIGLEAGDGLGAAEELFETLRRRALVAAFAESCTGGLCASLITAIPGSSAVFSGAVVSYSNAAKADLLGVRPETLERHGAVSEASVAAMAEGAALRLHADCALAVSGIAGPDGGSADKPVGTVWIAWRGPGFARQRCYRFDGDRAAIRMAAARSALLGLDRLLQGAEPDQLQA